MDGSRVHSMAAKLGKTVRSNLGPHAHAINELSSFLVMCPSLCGHEPQLHRSRTKNKSSKETYDSHDMTPASVLCREHLIPAVHLNGRPRDSSAAAMNASTVNVQLFLPESTLTHG